MPETLTDEQRLNEFSTKLDSFKPEGFDDESFNKLKSAVIDFHKDDVQGLKINTAKAIQEKDDMATKYKALQTSSTESAAKIEELQKQLQANQPEEKQKWFDNEIAQTKMGYEKQLSDMKTQLENLTTKNKELEKGVLERDVYADFNKAASEKDWLGGARESAFKVALAGIEFTRLPMPDGTTTLIDKKTSKDVKTILNDFCGTELGKSFLRSGSSGGGADGSTAGTGSGRKLTEAQFNALDPQAQMDAVLNGQY